MKKFEELKRFFETGKISRREFIARVSALGITVGFMPTLFTSPALANTPKKGGRFRMGIQGGATTDTIDPATITHFMQVQLSNALRNNLAEYDHKGNAIPELAESWEASSDASQWIFNLRKGVEFHNGKTMEAEDVIYSINYHRSADSKSGGKALIEQVEDIKADGKYSVIFKLKAGNADFPYILTAYQFVIVPAGTKGKDFEKGIGTGGYVLQSWEPGVMAIAKRNPNYFKSNRAHFNEIEMLVINDANARINALFTNRVDYVTKVSPKFAKRVEDKQGFQTINNASGFHYDMGMRCDMEPYSNNDVRLAMKYAIDRELMVKNLLSGYGKVGNDTPISSHMRYFNNELPQRVYDPDKAKFHLKKAGLPNHTFKIHSAEIAEFMGAVQLYKEQAAKAGINIEILKVPEDGYWSDIWLKSPFSLSYWAGRPTVDMALSISYWSGASWNETHFKHGRFDNLLIMARSELDEKKRAEMYADCQKILWDEGGSIVYLFKDYIEAANLKVRFGKIAVNYESDGTKAAERWWFAS